MALSLLKRLLGRRRETTPPPAQPFTYLPAHHLALREAGKALEEYRKTLAPMIPGRHPTVIQGEIAEAIVEAAMRHYEEHDVHGEWARALTENLNSKEHNVTHL